MCPKKVLFGLLSDHENLGRFFDAEYSLVKHGKPEINGIGAVRKVISGPFTFQEQIIDYKENEHLHYKIIQGGPIDEHGGWIRFQSINANQSLIHYRIKFSPRIRGNRMAYQVASGERYQESTLSYCRIRRIRMETSLRMKITAIPQLAISPAPSADTTRLVFVALYKVSSCQQTKKIKVLVFIPIFDPIDCINIMNTI